MTLVKLIQEGANVSITVSLSELKDLVEYTINEAKKELEETITAGKADFLLTAEKVCEMLSVNRSTLWRWGEKKYLLPVKVGGKNRYKTSDINKLMKSGGVGYENEI